MMLRQQQHYQKAPRFTFMDLRDVAKTQMVHEIASEYVYVCGNLSRVVIYLNIHSKWAKKRSHLFV